MEELPKNLSFEIAEKSDKTRSEVMDLLHEYPDQFVQGVFEPMAEEDLAASDVMIARMGDVPIGCLMFNRATNEYNWLAVKKDIPFPKSEVAKKLFESFYPGIGEGVEVHLFVNTEDAHLEGREDFTGKSFDPARKLYRSMGIEIKEENRVENKFGPGAHAYRVAWVPNKKELPS